jgi:hypothetical protein
MKDLFKEVRGEVKLYTGRMIEYSGKIATVRGRPLGKVKIKDKTGLEHPCMFCDSGKVRRYADVEYVFFGLFSLESGYSRLKSEEEKQLFEEIGNQMN